MQSDNVTALLSDRDGGLWAALNDGVARVEASAHVGRFDERSGLRGGPQAFARVPSSGGAPDRVFAGTSIGLFEMERATRLGDFATFRPIEALATTVWKLMPPKAGSGDPLLVGASEGLFELATSGGTDRVERVWTEETAYSLLRDPGDASLIWVGGETTLFGVREADGRYETVHRFEVGDTVRSLYADSAGRIWGATGATGILRLDSPDGPLRRYGADSGFTGDLERLFLSFADDQPLATSLDSVRVYDAARDRFVARPDWFGPLKVSSITQPADRSIWVFGGPTENQQVLLRYPRRGAAPDTVLTRLGYSFIGEVYHTDGPAIWATTLRGLFRAIPPGPDRPPLAARVHRVATLDADSTLYSGFGPSELATPLSFGQRAVRIAFAAAAFDEPAATRYQVRLLGLDGQWSRWTDEAQRDYTNLSPGHYTFEVRARDVHGRVSEPAAFAFAVLPPWYRTLWAYGLYALLTLGLVAAAGRWQSTLRDRREEALEREVRVRTAEVEQQARELRRLNEALGKQAAELRRTNEELWETAELKAYLLGMAAHDLQTPLTSVLGFSDILLDEIPPDDERHHLARRIRDASDEMRVLIRDLLDSVAAQTGRLHLKRQIVDLCEVAAEAVRRLEPQAERKDQVMRFLSSGPAMADVDADRVRDAMTNLLSNAVKYAPPFTAITVRATLKGERFAFSVRDQGPGLTPEEQERLFRPFERLSPQPTGGEASSGLGLFLVQEIAHLHGGEVRVESEAGDGSTFTLLLPADALPVDGGSLADGAVPAEREQQQ
jgi:signal transduction histidine kinase